jgi:hypothetical protein
MTRRLLVIAVLLLGLVIGYLAGCRSHVQSRTVTRDPQPGQHWRDRGGSERIVRCLTREGGHVSVWWYRDGFSADRHCTLATWRAWARTKGAVPE